MGALGVGYIGERATAFQPSEEALNPTAAFPLQRVFRPTPGGPCQGKDGATRQFPAQRADGQWLAVLNEPLSLPGASCERVTEGSPWDFVSLGAGGHRVLVSRVCLSAQFKDVIGRNKSLTFRRRKM